MYKALRPLLFSLNAEHAHDLTVAATATAGKFGLMRHFLPRRVADPVELMGLTFANRVGLAAGLDKDGRCMHGMQALGFGFLEIGTVTPLAQPGNPQPRLFRLPEYQSIINRMGFNNEGLQSLLGRLQQLQRKPLDVPLGINLGKNKITPAERATEDYLQGLRAVYAFADYVTINLSSPNTPGLRDLQFGEPLDALLSALQQCREQLADQTGCRRPLLVKLAPDMSDEDLLQVSDRLLHFGMDGVIATNTTIDRSLVSDSPHAAEAGGLSGAVLFKRSTEVVELLARHVKGGLVIVGVGGINSADNAVAKIAAGADLVQLYSGLVYQGPGLVHCCAKAIKRSRADA
ncbi:MAG: quinone-dependent dihydroorotate dehydrogenase [Pseudomonadales bacterium]|nr:quinone-dependent dihydroorotate dehydrogenase [Pseudomonadales bacterium]